jgi:hypothetical protein
MATPVRVLIPLAVALSISACAKSVGMPLRNLGQDYDQTRVSIRGVLRTESTRYQSFHLCPGDSVLPEYRGCIDLVLTPRLARDFVDAQQACVVATGRFNAFGPERVGLGNFRSSIGFIELDELARCR